MKRIAVLIQRFLVSMLGALLLVSVFIDLLPGDPIELLLGEQAIEVDRHNLIQTLHLDQPLYARIGLFIRDLVQGELKSSVPPCRTNVITQLQHVYPNTLTLTVAALCMGLGLGAPLSLLTVLTQKPGLRRAVSWFTIVFCTIPLVWLGPVLLLVFAIALDWLPVSGFDSITGLILPMVSLGLGMAAVTARLLTASLQTQMRADFIRTARAKGLDAQRTLWIHALKNAAVPVVTVTGMQMGALLGGSIVAEKVFGFPGVGSLLMGGILQRDYNLVRVCVLALTASYVLANLIADLVCQWLDPRFRTAERTL